MPRFARLLAVLLIFLLHPMVALAQTGLIDPNTQTPAPGTNCGVACGLPDESSNEDNQDERSRSAPPRVVLIGFGQPEIVVSGPVSEFAAAVAALEELGGELRRYRDLPTLGLRFAAFRLGESALARARVALQDAAPNSSIGLHHIYGLAQGRPRVYAATMIGDSAPGACPVGRRLAIGLIDGPVDPNHPALAGARVVSQTVLAQGERAPSTSHGTSVAALLVGQDPDGALEGFAPGAVLYAVSAFTEIRQNPGADIERIATAIDWLLGQGVQLINMSFAGPENPVLAEVLSRAAARGVVMIAAAGNDGQLRAAYPAAHPDVIAVTAVDAAFRRYRDANFGDHIEFAAPGVDLYVASREDGGGYASGTSFAAPIVTALAARLGAGRGLSTEALRAALRGTAVDLGPDGFDDQFGWGLVHGGC